MEFSVDIFKESILLIDLMRCMFHWIKIFIDLVVISHSWLKLLCNCVGSLGCVLQVVFNQGTAVSFCFGLSAYLQLGIKQNWIFFFFHLFLFWIVSLPSVSFSYCICLSDLIWHCLPSLLLQLLFDCCEDLTSEAKHHKPEIKLH